MDKLSELYANFNSSVAIAECYAMALKLSIVQSRKYSIDTVEKIFDILKNNPVFSILEIAIEVLDDCETEEKNVIKEKFDNEVFIAVAKALDSHLFSNTVDNPKQKKIELIKKAIDHNLVVGTKYELQKDWFSKYDNKKVKHLLNLYLQVQTIKYHLSLKKFPKRKFGHYTSSKVLQILLKQKGNGLSEDGNGKKYEITEKTRLSNSNYMNDPEEGKILDKILNLEESRNLKMNELKPSSWFLVSFTTETDDLAMWSQYGSDAEGVCVVLKRDNFSIVKELSEMEWMQQRPIKSETASWFLAEGSEDNTFTKEVPTDNKTGSYLYRICYVNTSKGEPALEKTELFTQYEIEPIDKTVSDLKQLLKTLERISDDNFQEDIHRCLEEIRYLFKSSAYQYESELRILKYADLNPDSKLIKIDNTQDIAKLYVESDYPIKLDRIVFGPKFKNPEYVTPLVKLLDKNIECKKSEIKFR